MLTFHATEQIKEVSRTTTTQVITRYFGRWPQTKKFPMMNGHELAERSISSYGSLSALIAWCGKELRNMLTSSSITVSVVGGRGDI